MTRGKRARRRGVDPDQLDDALDAYIEGLSDPSITGEYDYSVDPPPMSSNPEGAETQRDFETGSAYTSQRDINPGNRPEWLQKYDELVSPGAEGVQNALLRLLGNQDPNLPLNKDIATRMAASEAVLNILKALPALGAAGGVVAAGDVVAGEESFANKGMDLLGMGTGTLYGMRNRSTLAGKVGGALLGMGIGKLGSDAIQGGIGGMV